MDGKRALEDLDDDIRDHIERETESNIARGMSPDEARRQALVSFGSIALVREDTRAVRTWIRAEQCLQDFRYAMRTLRRSPRFAAVVILTLAVAIGMNTAILSVFNAVVVRPPGYPHPDRLVWLSTVGMDGEAGMVTGPDFVDWRDRAQSFDRMVAYGTADFTLAAANGATRVRAAMVTEDFWDLSGAAPAAGRLPRSREREVVLLSQGFAQRWFPGELDVVGRTVTLDGRQVTVVGVLPEDFRFHLPGAGPGGLRPRAIDLYHPLLVSSARAGPMQLLSVVGRLKPATTLEQARAEVEAIRARIAQAQAPPFEDHRTLRLVPLHQELIGGAGRALGVLLVAVSFVLVIACGNAANLLLARTSARHREIAVRIALGAGRLRVLRQLLAETLALAALGSAGGLVLAQAGIAIVLRMDPHAIPRLAETAIDWRVLLLVLATCVLTVVITGLAPALALWKTNPHEALKGDPAVASGGRSLRTRRILVGSQVALALVLLIGAGLMVKSAWRMTAYPPGFIPQRILTASIELAGPQYADRHRRLAFADALLGRLKEEPGVVAASLTTHGSSLTAGLDVEGERAPTPEELARKPPILINATTATLPHVLGLRQVRGRWFHDGEQAAVLNESLVRRDFSGRDPIGRRLRLSESGPPLTIVGVVADSRYSQLDAPVEPELYVPYAHVDDGLLDFDVLALTSGDPVAFAPRVRALLSGIDSTQAATEIVSLEWALADSIAPRRLNLLLFGTFAAVALFLAIVGIYGVMAYAVAQRAHEIGIRIALGARRPDIVRMVVGQGMRVTLAGIVAGLAGALALTRFMESLLFEVEPTDPWTFAALTAVLAGTSFLACCGPALRAALVDPIETLRCE